jgi:hypothetical protein
VVAVVLVVAVACSFVVIPEGNLRLLLFLLLPLLALLLSFRSAAEESAVRNSSTSQLSPDSLLQREERK